MVREVDRRAGELDRTTMYMMRRRGGTTAGSGAAQAGSSMATSGDRQSSSGAERRRSHNGDNEPYNDGDCERNQYGHCKDRSRERKRRRAIEERESDEKRCNQLGEEMDNKRRRKDENVARREMSHVDNDEERRGRSCYRDEVVRDRKDKEREEKPRSSAYSNEEKRQTGIPKKEQKEMRSRPEKGEVEIPKKEEKEMRSSQEKGEVEIPKKEEKKERRSRWDELPDQISASVPLPTPSAPENATTSPYLMLNNVFDKSIEEEKEFYLAVRDGLHSECSRNGLVVHDTHFEVRAGCMCFRFDSILAAVKAKEMFEGHERNGREISCSFLPFNKYAQRFGFAARK